MAVAEPQPNRPVFDPTLDPDADGPPPAQRRYWISAAIGMALLASFVAFLLRWG